MRERVAVGTVDKVMGWITVFLLKLPIPHTVGKDDTLDGEMGLDYGSYTQVIDLLEEDTVCYRTSSL